MQTNTTQVIVNAHHDPYRNLAVEEYLLDRLAPGQVVLYLWQNQNTVVIGKNQNPWKECRVDILEQEGGKLARRLSGGGAVFHDLGNLNFSFLIERRLYDFPKQLGVILAAVRQLGIHAEFTGRNDLTVDGKKFSGNAFCLRAQAALHHGTILLGANLDRLTRYLQVSREKIRAKGIESVRSRVANLQSYQPKLTLDELTAALSQSFLQTYGAGAVVTYEQAGFDSQEMERLYGKYSSWDWRFGEAPEFDIEMDTRFAWGGLHLCLQLENAKIQRAYAYSDAMEVAWVEKIPQALLGCQFHSGQMANAILQIPTETENKAMLADIAQWLAKKGF